MNVLVVAVFLGSVLYCTNAQSCDSPHEGDGRMLDENGGYIQGNLGVLLYPNYVNDTLAS